MHLQRVVTVDHVRLALIDKVFHDLRNLFIVHVLAGGAFKIAEHLDEQGRFRIAEGVALHQVGSRGDARQRGGQRKKVELHIAKTFAIYKTSARYSTSSDQACSTSFTLLMN